MELLKLLSTSELFAQVVSFLLLLFLLRVFAWKRLLKLLDDRRERISSEFKKIDEAKSEVEKLRESYEARLASVSEEARAKILEAVNEGRRQAEELRQNALSEGQALIARARDDVKAEILKAEEKLKNRIVNLTIDAAEKVMQEKLSEGQDRKLIEAFLKELETEK